MGVINKLLYRGTFLGKPRHRNLFLDMEENIHIHYRDLRIELSRAEFEEFAAIFQRHSAELLGIITERSYQDGKLPNANQEDVRVWTDSRLETPVTYHPQRVSIEDCSDGFHIHYRNYKLLVDKDDFLELVAAFRRLDPAAPYPASHADVLALIEANDIDFLRAADDRPPHLLSLRVAPYHVRKVESILGNIGIGRVADVKPRRYAGTELEVQVEPYEGQALAWARGHRGQASLVPLTAYLADAGSGIDPDELNLIKCQVLDCYNALLRDGDRPVDTDYRHWIYDRARARVIFPFLDREQAKTFTPRDMYRYWKGFQVKHKIWFVKPGKRVLEDARQKRLLAALDERIEALARAPQVHRIHVMGSAKRAALGVYAVPFVHGQWAKLGSDIDLLIEIVPGREAELPAGWTYVNHSESNDCDIYHVGEIPLLEQSEYVARFPDIEFFNHLLDAYVFLPSRDDPARKDAFLRKFNARVAWEWRGTDPEATAQSVAQAQRLLGDDYGIGDAVVEPWRVSSQNRIFRVQGDGGLRVLKQFLVSGNYDREQVARHVAYEAALIDQLRERGVATAAVVPRLDGGHVSTLDAVPCLLFELLEGERLKRPEYPLQAVAEALAVLHLRQLECPVELECPFDFAGLWKIWQPAFERFAVSEQFPGELRAAAAALQPVLAAAESAWFGERATDRLPAVHNHGDVAPKNVIVDAAGTARLFDFNNAFLGSRLFDIVDGAYEFSLAEKYARQIDFARFDALLDAYRAVAPLDADERRWLPCVVDLFGIVKFTKEMRGYEEQGGSKMRVARALAIGDHLLARQPSRARA